VFDVTRVKDFGPAQPYARYAWRDISCALAKYSIQEEDLNIHGFERLSESELVSLDSWFAIFL
jgi:hypothetical protein